MELRIFASLDEAVREICGSERKVIGKKYVAGGDINTASALLIDDGTRLFMKSNAASFLKNFKAEAQGLAAIRQAGGPMTPRVLGAGLEKGGSFLLLEYISGGAPVRDYWETFAAQLAAMHKAAAEKGIGFGFTSDNFIGERDQINTPRKSWIEFMRDCRLRPQFDAASGYFDREDRKWADHLLSHLDEYLVEPAKPSLIHGDLWGGNKITGNDGRCWLIDPAVYYAHPEADIAMTELFGGFPHAFYRAYEETGCLQDGYADRRDLYNLYHLLNHLNTFGGSYLSSVRRILKRYVGGI